MKNNLSLLIYSFFNKLHFLNPQIILWLIWKLMKAKNKKKKKSRNKIFKPPLWLWANDDAHDTLDSGWDLPLHDFRTEKNIYNNFK